MGAQIALAAQAAQRGHEAGLTTIEELAPPASDRSMRALLTRLGDYASAQTLVVLQDLTALRHAERARRMLLANITHDLRTPLTSLQALLDALEDGALAEPAVARDFLRRMATEVQGLRHLVDEFLELSRIEQGQVALQLTPVAPRALLMAAAGRMEAQAHQKRVRIAIETAEGLPLVDVDVGRMEQVLLNLLQNALAATPASGQITLSAHADGATIVLAVHDTGSGISPTDLPHIFERFYKADPARDRGGAGLGLAIAKHLVERHGGQIMATSTTGSGTTLSITLPTGTAFTYR
jgi:two-component system phosphate regulon sensor histidine kinase PhoR